MIDDRERRFNAAEACVARFDRRAYAPGKRDCVKLATHALMKMGHGSGVLKGLTYRTEAEGFRHMRRAGFTDLIDAMDAKGLPEIAPVMAWQGDVVALKSEDDTRFGCALAVMLSDGQVLSFVNGWGHIFVPTQIEKAWRL